MLLVKEDERLVILSAQSCVKVFRIVFSERLRWLKLFDLRRSDLLSIGSFFKLPDLERAKLWVQNDELSAVCSRKIGYNLCASLHLHAWTPVLFAAHEDQETVVTCNGKEGAVVMFIFGKSCDLSLNLAFLVYAHASFGFVSSKLLFGMAILGFHDSALIN